MTFADMLQPSFIRIRHRAVLLYDVVLIIGGSLFVGLSARIAIPLPFSPVPITGQTLTVLFVGALLGSRRAGEELLAEDEAAATLGEGKNHRFGL